MEHQMLQSISDQLVAEILIMLPVKSLLRFRVVCKDWRTMIDSKNFVNWHLSRSIEIGTNSSFIIKDFSFQRYCVDSKSLEEAVKLNIPSGRWPEAEEGSATPSLGGSCNGLLCLCYDEATFALWNPSTMKKLLLPPLTFDDFGFLQSDIEEIFGFGYDVTNDDYKVVNIKEFYLVSDDDEEDFVDNVANVYSLRSNSWQSVYCFPKGVNYEELGVLLQGSLHWLVVGDEYHHEIVAFDITKQEVYIIPIPISCKNGFNDAFLYTAEGCLSISFFRCDVGLDLWVLNEYGLEDSWTKLISIHDPNLVDRPRWDGGFSQLVPLFCSKNSGVLLFILYENTGSDIFWYNFQSQSTKKVNVRGLPKGFSGGELLVESLVRLDGWWS